MHSIQNLQDLDTYTHSIMIHRTKHPNMQGALNNGAGCAKAQCLQKSVTGNNS